VIIDDACDQGTGHSLPLAKWKSFHPCSDFGVSRNGRRNDGLCRFLKKMERTFPVLIELITSACKMTTVQILVYITWPVVLITHCLRIAARLSRGQKGVGLDDAFLAVSAVRPFILLCDLTPDAGQVFVHGFNAVVLASKDDLYHSSVLRLTVGQLACAV